MRSRTNYWIAGVFGGLGKQWGISPLLLRVLFILFGHALGLGVVLYIIAAAFMPLESES